MPQGADLDGEEGCQESDSDWRDPGRRLFVCEKPPAKPADEERHRQKGRSSHAKAVTDKGSQRGVQAQVGKDRAEKTQRDRSSW